MRVRKMGWIMLVPLLITACNQSHEKQAVDSLYVPDGYQSKISALGLKEVAAKPYFRSPFITIVEDAKGKQSAMVFRDHEKPKLVALPKTYEEIIKKLEDDKKALTETDKQNIHLLEINGDLYWNYEASDSGSVYLNLEGIEQSPFS
ncbi:hypothetical protein B9G55_12995 [Saccharibacillus sp. O16]|nr:hypothetical protein B9G55_12995 [Saccharibacillus sp. O16]